MNPIGTFALVSLSILAGAALAAPTAQGQQKPRVALETSKGRIVIELAPDEAPATVENFLRYVEDDFYDNTVFHRVIGPNPRQPQGFMIQGGGFAAGSPITEKPTREPIKNEGGNGLKNERGTVAMARTPDPDSATAQFFVNLGDNSFLNRGDPNAGDAYGYAVFGRVVEGMDVVDAIAGVETGRAPAQTDAGRQIFSDVPTEPVVIQSASRVEP